MQYAIVNSSSKLSDADCAFIAAVLQTEAIACADAWGVQRPAVAYYTHPDGLPVASGEVRVIHIVDDVGNPGSLGWHTVIGGYVVTKVEAQDVDGTCCTVGHELFESLIDPGCDQWRKRRDGTSVALEVSDPVEADSYPVTVTLAGETRTLRSSNFVTPKWFDEGDVDRATQRDKMDHCRAPFEMTPGGYVVVQDASGNETDVYAREDDERGWKTAERKRANPESRLSRRLT